MIDTDKYEGHTKDDETWSKYANWATARYLRDADEQLIADAPLLLAEVKQVNHFIKWVKDTHPHAYRDLKKAYERREDKL